MILGSAMPLPRQKLAHPPPRVAFLEPLPPLVFAPLPPALPCYVQRVLLRDDQLNLLGRQPVNQPDIARVLPSRNALVNIGSAAGAEAPAEVRAGGAERDVGASRHVAHARP